MNNIVEMVSHNKTAFLLHLFSVQSNFHIRLYVVVNSSEAMWRFWEHTNESWL